MPNAARDVGAPHGLARSWPASRHGVEVPRWCADWYKPSRLGVNMFHLMPSEARNAT